MKSEVQYLNYCLPTDIVRRLSRRKWLWFYGPPTIKLIGNTNSFGKLIFDFKDDIIDMSIYVKDRHSILNAANNVIKNFKTMCEELYHTY